jgi:hypothetical protein
MDSDYSAFSWSDAEKDLLAGIDNSVPVSARIWNYWLGGKDYYAVDQAAGDSQHRPGQNAALDYYNQTGAAPFHVRCPPFPPSAASRSRHIPVRSYGARRARLPKARPPGGRIAAWPSFTGARWPRASLSC